jgi:hypothetical protein
MVKLIKASISTSNYIGKLIWSKSGKSLELGYDIDNSKIVYKFNGTSEWINYTNQSYLKKKIIDFLENEEEFEGILRVDRKFMNTIINSKSPTKKSPTKKSPTKKSPTKKSSTKKSPTKKSPTKKSPTKKSSTKKSPTKKSSTKSLLDFLF